MRSALLVSAVLILTACGPGTEANDSPLDIQLITSAGLLDVLSAFQVSMVTNGSSLDCVTVQKSCIKSQVDAARFVSLKDSSGGKHKGLITPLNLVAGTPTTQDLSLTGLSLGKDFALIIEGLSKDTPPKLVATSCNFVRELTVGTNTTVQARVGLLSPVVSCDPRIDQ